MIVEAVIVIEGVTATVLLEVVYSVRGSCRVHLVVDVEASSILKRVITLFQGIFSNNLKFIIKTWICGLGFSLRG